MPKRKKRVARRKRTSRAVAKKRQKTIEALELKVETRRQISGYIQIALAVVFYLVILGNAGIAGAAVHDLITFFFGRASVLFPMALGLSGLFLLMKKESNLEFRSAVGLTICLVSVLGLIHIQAPFQEIGIRRAELGGAIGFMMSFPLLAFTSLPVAYVVLTALLLIGALITFEMGIADVVRILHRIAHPHVEEEEEEEGTKSKRARKSATADASDLIEAGMQRGDEESGKRAKKSKKQKEEEMNIVRPAFATEELKGRKKGKAKKEESSPAMEAIKDRVVKAQPKQKDEDMEVENTRFDDWEFPSLDCLDDARSEVMVDDETLQAQAELIEKKLKQFDIEVKTREAHPGPTVTQFALEPAEGVKLSRIASLKSDLALALAAPSLRIEAPIPGKSLVGIEMPNVNRTTVHLREILESPEFREMQSPLTLPFGRDVSGKAIVEDLAEMPHLLIAGATGSGKSVCMNTFLISLIYQNAPHELKFILIDPKRVELTSYEGIPHLLTPVITESEKALKALRWVVAEMGRRLARFSEAGARNLQEFNDKHEEEQHMPRIVVVIDELADLMMRQYRRDTEMMITRIAQIARATGIHLIIATQRPSVDVITGIIKANIPTRIAFRTVSSIDSRTILDSTGSEDLLGKGDMLRTNASTPVPMRVQGIFVSTKEVERVMNQVKIAGGGQITASIPLGPQGTQASGQQGDDSDDESTGTPLAGASMAADREHEVVGEGPEIDLDADDDGGDDLTFEAIEIVRRSGKASASLLQRHLKVGYARAARILDIMEEKGVIGPGEGAKARKVYVE
jgi:S-DNA-T family DNA segregation ATPase FtsK/SpoIIIE